LVTGANSGLGLLTARALAGAGARVLLACRNPERAAAALREVAGVARGPAPETVALDLADLDSVAAAAADVAARTDALDILVDNAGIMAPPLGRTVQGFERQFGVNHLGHFALAGRLLPKLLAARAPRVVTVSSNAHLIGRMHWSDLDAQHHYSAWARYGQSKLANLLFTAELDRRAQLHGTDLVAVAAHPGYAATGLPHNGPGNQGANRFMDNATRLADRLFAQSAEQGAIPQIHAATAVDAQGNDYFGPSGLLAMRGGHATRVTRSAHARDTADARRLWEVSAEMTGVDYAWPDAAGSDAAGSDTTGSPDC
ncbi:MAG: SDR family NAD(P)-dependent oxidoreductase, partial [Actinobacteria bacterium]|nr:SDR family NAD(P)-dependent oxidoreductase [Actinomycetota bacterium]